MCIHYFNSLDQAVENVRWRSGVMAATYEVVAVYRDERFVGAWFADIRKPTSVARVIRDLKDWHSNANRVDLSRLNAERAKHALSPLDEAGLPIVEPTPQVEIDVQMTQRADYAEYRGASEQRRLEMEIDQFLRNEVAREAVHV